MIEQFLRTCAGSPIFALLIFIEVHFLKNTIKNSYHPWHIDLTAVPTGLGFWFPGCPWRFRNDIRFAGGVG
jgi:hypothetical protein